MAQPAENIKNDSRNSGGVQVVPKRPRDLPTGAMLARPVFNSNGARLFKEHKRLDLRDLDRLKNWNIRRVYVYTDGTSSVLDEVPTDNLELQT